MPYTNKLNLPEVIVRAVQKNTYNKNANYSITELLTPPQITQLLQRHDAKIKRDVSDQIYALRGSAIHSILEMGAVPGDLCEERLYLHNLQEHFDIEKWNMTLPSVSGQIDYYDIPLQTLWDWKEMSVWEVIYGIKPEREMQLNCYAALMRENGYNPQHLMLGVILRDWKKTEAARKPDYPQHQILTFEVPMWPHEQAMDFIKNRLRLHTVAADRSDSSLPPCTAEERWATEDKWAVMKEGRKTAVRVYDDRELASDHAASESKCYVEYRPGESKRCESYCDAAPFCHQFQNM